MGPGRVRHRGSQQRLRYCRICLSNISRANSPKLLSRTSYSSAVSSIRMIRTYSILAFIETDLLLFESMCHCLFCDCWWCNCGKICCAGVSLNLLCCSTWCCKAEELLSFHYECVTCCCNKAADRAGCGMVTACLGSICCAPEWLRQYYKKK